MTDRYLPPSDFLNAIIAEDVPLSGGALADANLQLLMAMTADDDAANRDWATMLLAQQNIDTPQVREALLRSAHDADENVRSEAILGLAQRDPVIALPLIREALAQDSVQLGIFEAAEIIASPELVALLLPFSKPGKDQSIDEQVLRALEACRACKD
ncbi:HEAT repeat domain-containing protein [Sphingobium phenoxybenzoativorans]|uniref:HEAT repeat domain-containing protein n=1 Tax=Sphingobium phenoxybenzoativorans TaxID=1592790 RepID=UPI0008725A57|nr:HEAT repeat domain-containing protein [Sphingobium phenoxybenzoativorans]